MKEKEREDNTHTDIFTHKIWREKERGGRKKIDESSPMRNVDLNG